MLEPAWIGKIEPVSRSTVRVALNTGEILTSDWSNCGHPQKNRQAAIAEDLLKHPGSSCSSSRVHLARPAFPGRLPSWCSCAGRTSSPLPSRAAGFSLRRTAVARTDTSAVSRSPSTFTPRPVVIRSNGQHPRRRRPKGCRDGELGVRVHRLVADSQRAGHRSVAHPQLPAFGDDGVDEDARPPDQRGAPGYEG